jgi:hypothetical protein
VEGFFETVAGEVAQFGTARRRGSASIVDDARRRTRGAVVGYTETHREFVAETLSLFHLAKPAE